MTEITRRERARHDRRRRGRRPGHDRGPRRLGAGADPYRQRRLHRRSGGRQRHLTFGGRSYSLGIGGVSVGATIGASTTELIGTASNLRSPRDIEGVYTAAGAGAAIAGGARVINLSNSRGVMLRLRGRKIGLEFSIDLSGMQISLR